MESLQGRLLDGRRHRRATVAVSTGALTLAVLVGGLSLTHTGGGGQDLTVTGPVTAPTTSRTPVPAGSTPAGYVRVNYGEASAAVPAAWEVSYDGTACDPSGQGVVVSPAPIERGCAGVSSPQGYASLEPVHAHLSGSPVTINGHHGTELTTTSAQVARNYEFPDLGVVLTVAGPRSATIVSSISWSASHLVLHPAAEVTVPAEWRAIRYQGITLRIPGTWSVLTLGTDQAAPGASCGSDREFVSPGVDEGTGYYSYCPNLPLSTTVATGTDGVWLRSDPSKGPGVFPAGAQTLRNTGLELAVVNEAPEADAQPVLHLVAVDSSGNPVAIDIGLGADPATARSIIASLSNVVTQPLSSTPSSTSTTSQATLIGTLQAVGGSSPGLPRPLAGTITIQSATNRYTVKVGADGRYSIQVPAGTYTVTGLSPSYLGGDGPCQADNPIVASPGTSTAGDVECSEK